ncbi:MAG: MarR family winged helix-turn-helix transcriptional regulator [Acetatifactor sp.]
MKECREKKTRGAQRAAHYHAADINDRIIINIRDLNHIMHFLYEGKASQNRILIIMHEVKCITQRELTERLGIQPGSASEVLAKLENAELITRMPSETDRRTTNITLTQKGEQLALAALEQRNRRHMEMFSCLADDEKTELLALLEKINEDWSHRYQEPDGCGHKPPHHGKHC